MLVQLQFSAMAHFHLPVEMDEETFKKFKALKEDNLLSEYSDGELWKFIVDNATPESYDHLEDGTDIENAVVEEYIDYPLNNKTYEELLESKGVEAVRKERNRMAKILKARVTEI